MNDRQEDKLGMYLAVLRTLDKHADARDSLPAFADAAAEFNTTVDRIRDASTRQHVGIAGAGAKKRTAREALIDIAQPVGAALATWAAVAGDLRLASRVQHYRTDYVRARDTIAASMARTVHAEATARLADTSALADYGIDQGRLDTLAAAIDHYEAQIARPRAAIHERKAVTAEIKAGFADADSLLRERLDPLAAMLATDWSEFAVDWRNSRKIVDSGRK